MKLYKDADGKDIQPDWEQRFVEHCPDSKCKGLLLSSLYYHPMKCSKCGKLWMSINKWVEVKELS